MSRAIQIFNNKIIIATTPVLPLLFTVLLILRLEDKGMLQESGNMWHSLRNIALMFEELCCDSSLYGVEFSRSCFLTDLTRLSHIIIAVHSTMWVFVPLLALALVYVLSFGTYALRRFAVWQPDACWCWVFGGQMPSHTGPVTWCFWSHLNDRRYPILHISVVFTLFVTWIVLLALRTAGHIDANYAGEPFVHDGIIWFVRLHRAPSLS